MNSERVVTGKRRKEYPSKVKVINGQKCELIGINARGKRLYAGFLQLYAEK